MVTCVCNWLREYRSYLTAYIFKPRIGHDLKSSFMITILEIDAWLFAGDIDYAETALRCVCTMQCDELYENQVFEECLLL